MVADGAPPSDGEMAASLAATYSEAGQISTTMCVTLRLRTPLSTVADSFVDALHERAKRYHDAEYGDDEHPFRPDNYTVSQGAMSSAGSSVHHAQRINPHLTPWHYGLQSDSVLTFTTKHGLAD